MEGRCRRAERCANAETVSTTQGRQRAGAPIPAPGLCPPCTSDAQQKIAWLPRDYVDLLAHIGTDASSQAGEPVGGTRERPVPLRLGIEHLASQLAHGLLAWAAPVAERLGIDWTPLGPRVETRLGPKVDRASELLARHMPVLLALPVIEVWTWSEEGDARVQVQADGVEGAMSLVDAHHLAQRALGHARLVHRLAVPCPDCDLRALERENGSERVRCRGCGSSWAWDDYDALARKLAVEVQAARRAG